jgi:hypothetical protein
LLQAPLPLQPHTPAGSAHLAPFGELSQSPSAAQPQTPWGKHLPPLGVSEQSPSWAQPHTPLARHTDPVSVDEQSMHAAPGVPHVESETSWQSLLESQQPLHCVPGPQVEPHVPFGWQASPGWQSLYVVHPQVVPFTQAVPAGSSVQSKHWFGGPQLVVVPMQAPGTSGGASDDASLDGASPAESAAIAS